MTIAPIALFVYNRPDHTRRTVEALQKNVRALESELIIFSDGPKNTETEKAVHEVRTYIKTIAGFKSVKIIESTTNRGLAQSIIAGVTDVVNRFGRIIVVEDDLVTSPYFLTYMNTGLDLYENEARVASIHGYIYPVKSVLPETFFLRGADCWGWSTWKRAWDIFEPDGAKLLSELQEKDLITSFDMDGSYSYSSMLERQIRGENNSWAIRWHASVFLKNMLTLYPGVSLVQNIGQDNSGTHAGGIDQYGRVDIRTKEIVMQKIAVHEDPEIRRIIVDYFRARSNPNIIRRIWNKISK